MPVNRILSDMQAVSTRRFLRDFSRVRRNELTITDRGQVLGTWTPAAGKPRTVDYAKRVREYCSAPLPFTGAQLLKEGKKRSMSVDNLKKLLQRKKLIGIDLGPMSRRGI